MKLCQERSSGQEEFISETSFECRNQFGDDDAPVAVENEMKCLLCDFATRKSKGKETEEDEEIVAIGWGEQYPNYVGLLHKDVTTSFFASFI